MRYLASLQAGITMFALIAMSSPLMVMAQEEPLTPETETTEVVEEETFEEEEEEIVEEVPENLLQTALEEVFELAKKDKEKEKKKEKVEVCHVTPSQTMVIEVDEEGWNGHDGHDDDFLIETEEQEEWCESNKIRVVKEIEETEASPEDFSFTVTETEEDDDSSDSETYEFDEDGEVFVLASDDDDKTYDVTEVDPGSNYTVSYESCTDISFYSDDDEEYELESQGDDEDDEDDEDDKGKIKTCVITNTYNEPEVPETCEITSNTVDFVVEKDDNAFALVSPYLHDAWADFVGGLWIWGDAQVTNPDQEETQTFKKNFEVSQAPTSAVLHIAADNGARVLVNGVEVLDQIDGLDDGDVHYNDANTEEIDILAHLIVGDVNTLEIQVKNLALLDNPTPERNPAGLNYKIVFEDTLCEASEYTPEPEEETAILHATKIVCPLETSLPNWGAGNVVGAITATTAGDFLTAHPECSLQPDWQFQWATDAAGDPEDNDNVALPSPWATITTAQNGSVMTEVPAGINLRVREVLKPGYIPFTGQNTTLSESAEMYCGSDVLNYDNWEWIDATQADTHYYCVAFNAPSAPSCDANAETVLLSSDDVENVLLTQDESGPASVVSWLHGSWLQQVGEWIWKDTATSAGDANSLTDVTEDFTRTFTIVGTPKNSTLEIAADNGYEVYVNNVLLVADTDEFNYGATESHVIPAGMLQGGVNEIRFVISNDAGKPGADTPETNPAGLLYKLTVKNDECDPYEPPAPTKATLSATKVVCDSEAFLPNSGQIANPITANTAAAWVAQSEGKCRLESGYDFQWAPNGTSDPEDNGTTPLGSPWVTFGSTNAQGVATTSVTVADVGGLIQVREVLKAGDVPYASDESGAKLYCASDVAGVDNWEWISNPVAGQTYHCVAFNARQTSDVTMCKVRENDGFTGLSGWTLMLKGAQVQNDLAIPVATVAGVDSVALEADTSYIAVANGVWRNSGQGQNFVDAEYSTLDAWTTPVDGFTGYSTNILELQIEEAFDPNADWGPFSSTHEYARSFTVASDGPANFRIFDGNGTTPEAGWYTDNVESTLAVDIFEGYAGVTGENGCVTFQDVPYGSYTASEIAKTDWTFEGVYDENNEPIQGTTVVVNEPDETFKLLNTPKDNGGGGGDPKGTVVIVKHSVGADGTFTFDLSEQLTVGVSVAPDATIETDEGYGTSTLIVDPGTYNLTENVPQGWTLQGITCEYDGYSEGTTITNGKTIYVGANDTVTCTFTNTKDGEQTQTSNTTVVSGNTSAGENLLGWLFNRDLSTQSPFEFNTETASIGGGSLNVLPITNTINGNNDKFIGELFLLTPMAGVEDITYDFRIEAPNGTVEEQFYMNVYANFGVSSPTKFYDCRYSVVPTVGSDGSFTTVTFDPDLTYPVTTRTGGQASPFTCPASPADMDLLSPGSTIRVVAINTGDTSASDLGVAGYFDKVVTRITTGTNTHTETYDFEPAPITPQNEDDGNSTGNRVRSPGNTGGLVLGASTECSPLLMTYLGKSFINAPTEVTKLQNFLNGEMGTALPLSGAFDSATEEAVHSFQIKYWEDVLKPWFGIPGSPIQDSDDSSGIVFKTTKWKINNLFCPGSEAMPMLP